MNNLTALNRAFVSMGFTLIRSKKHQIWGCPCGQHRVTASGTHNEGRGDQNARAQIARTLRKCKQQMEARQAE